MNEFIYKVRKYLHEFPEIGYETYNTANFIYNTLESLGLKPIYAMENRAVLCYLDLGKKETVGLRSDMDALPIIEESNCPFKSKNNYMHACGHDAHMTILLNTAKLICENIDKINYNILFIFQPAEEGPLPGGAYYLKEHPLVKKVDYFYAYHVSPDLEVGQIGIKIGEACAAPDLWELEIKGIGSHGSRPEKGINPIIIGSEIILKFEDFYQELKKRENIVLSTTYFNSGINMNIIKDMAYLKGTARSFNQKNRDFLNNEMENIIKNICDKYKANYKFMFHYAYPPLYNSDILADKIFNAAKFLGDNNLIKLKEPALIGEDFAYYKEIAPICLTWIGAREKGAKYYDLHNSHFVVAFETIDYGSQILLNLLTA